MNGYISPLLSENKSIKITKDEIGYYIIDPSQTIAALNNYHRNRNIDKYLELSKLNEIKLGKTIYKRKEYLTDIQHKTLWSLQRQAEKNATSMGIKFTQINSIRQRLEKYGSELEQKELTDWSKLADKLNDEYDLLIKKADIISIDQRKKVLSYLFGIGDDAFKKYYNELIIMADGLYLSMINLYDRAEDIGVKDIISTIMDQGPTEVIEQTTQSVVDTTKDVIKDRN